MGALRAGFSSVGRSYGLVVLLLAQNLVLAGILAGPMAVGLERDLRGTDAAARMTEGFDHAWWETWSERQTGPGRDLGHLALPPTGQNDAAPVWMPNSKAVLVTRAFGVQTALATARGIGGENRVALDLLPIDGGRRRTLTVVVHLQNATPSPGGTRVAFLREPTTTTNQYANAVLTEARDLWTVDVATGRLHRLTHYAPSDSLHADTNEYC